MSKKQRNGIICDCERTCCACTGRTDPTNCFIPVRHEESEHEGIVVKDVDEYEPTGIKFDIDAIPDFIREDLAAAAWNAVQRFMRRSDARAILDAEKERLISEGSTLLDPR